MARRRVASSLSRNNRPGRQSFRPNRSRRSDGGIAFHQSAAHKFTKTIEQERENLPDQFAMAAITFCDVVVSHSPFSDGLLFHELVHVEQYRQLGVQGFFRALCARIPEWRQL